METSQCCPLISPLQLRSFGKYEFSLCSSLISNLRHNFFFCTDPQVHRAHHRLNTSGILPPGTKYNVNLWYRGPKSTLAHRWAIWWHTPELQQLPSVTGKSIGFQHLCTTVKSLLSCLLRTDMKLPSKLLTLLHYQLDVYEPHIVVLYSEFFIYIYI